MPVVRHHHARSRPSWAARRPALWGVAKSRGVRTVAKPSVASSRTCNRRPLPTPTAHWHSRRRVLRHRAVARRANQVGWSWCAATSVRLREAVCPWIERHRWAITLVDRIRCARGRRCSQLRVCRLLLPPATERSLGHRSRAIGDRARVRAPRWLPSRPTIRSCGSARRRCCAAELPDFRWCRASRSTIARSARTPGSTAGCSPTCQIFNAHVLQSRRRFARPSSRPTRCSWGSMTSRRPSRTTRRTTCASGCTRPRPRHPSAASW